MTRNNKKPFPEPTGRDQTSETKALIEKLMEMAKTPIFGAKATDEVLLRVILRWGDSDRTASLSMTCSRDGKIFKFAEQDIDFSRVFTRVNRFMSDEMDEYWFEYMDGQELRHEAI